MCFDVPFYWCLIADVIMLAIVVGIPLGLILLVRYVLGSDDREDGSTAETPAAPPDVSNSGKQIKFDIEPVLICIVIALTYILAVFFKFGNSAVYVGVCVLGALIFMRFVRGKKCD